MSKDVRLASGRGSVDEPAERSPKLGKALGRTGHSDVRRALSVWGDERLRVARGPEERRRQAVQWIIQPKEQDD